MESYFESLNIEKDCCNKNAIFSRYCQWCGNKINKSFPLDIYIVLINNGDFNNIELYRNINEKEELVEYKDKKICDIRLNEEFIKKIEKYTNLIEDGYYNIYNYYKNYSIKIINNNFFENIEYIYGVSLD